VRFTPLHRVSRLLPSGGRETRLRTITHGDATLRTLDLMGGIGAITPW
jgi:hypothetical protein